MGQSTRYLFRAIRNRSKLVEGSLVSITDLLLGAKSIILYFQTLTAVWVDVFHKKILNLKRNFFVLVYCI